MSVLSTQFRSPMESNPNPSPEFLRDVAKGNLPPLPEIHSEQLRLQVFTHRSFFARQTHLFEDHPDDPSPDNEMLEHLGDSVLQLTVTDLLREFYPCLRVGAFAKIRALVVGNANLASISRHYGLIDELRMHPAQAMPLKASRHIQADIFEAYVGGLYLDQGLDAVRAWLRPLLQPYLRESYNIVRSEYGLPPPQSPAPLALNQSSRRGWSSNPPHNFSTVGHLALFNQRLQQKSKHVEWDYGASAGEGSKTTPVWIVQALVGGECVGRGRGNTKKAAQNEAAKEGLIKLGVSAVL